jgi:predicted metal-dependent phosphoesterase TrpH
MLKADLHIHTKEDVQDMFVNYPAKQLIDRAAEKGYEVLSITPHNALFNDKEIIGYAAQKNILIIPGIEKTVEGRHVLMYNVTADEAKKVKKISDLAKVRRKNTLIAAPHTFYPPVGLREKFLNNINLFDAVEYSYFYTKQVNPFNRMAVDAAKKYNKAVIGSSDLHNMRFFGKTFSLIDSKKTVNDVIQAIKNKRIKVVTIPFKTIPFLRQLALILLEDAIKIVVRGFRKP